MPTPQPARLPRSTPAALGVAEAGVAALFDAFGAHDLEVHSCMVLHHGRVIAEGWWRPYTPDTPHMLFSLSKSFTSTAVGLAVHEGLLSLDDPVTSFFPADLPPEVGPNLAAMRVRHLLTMGTGHHSDATGPVRAAGHDNWVRAFLALPVEHAPGSPFVYNSAATYMLSAIVQQRTGQTLLDYLTPRLFRPLGIEGATWESCPRGINAGGWGLSLTTEAIARFGQLYLQRGRWEDRQLLPADWVAEATAKQISNGDGRAGDWAEGYGYQFWRCRHGAYRGDGAHGQFCLVLPEQDAVVAMTGGTDRLQGVLDCVWEHLLPVLADGPARAGATAPGPALAERLGRLSLGPRGPQGRPADPAPGGTYRLDPNAAQLEALTLELDSHACHAVLVEAGVPRHLPFGFGDWRRGAAPLVAGQDPRDCAGLASWEEGGTLRLDWSFVGTPFGRTLRLRVSGGGLEGSYRTNVGQHAKGVEFRGARVGEAP